MQNREVQCPLDEGLDLQEPVVRMVNNEAEQVEVVLDVVPYETRMRLQEPLVRGADLVGRILRIILVR